MCSVTVAHRWGFSWPFDASNAGDFGYAAPDEQHHEGRQDAEQEHRPPADRVVAERAAEEQPVGDRGQQKAGRITALQDSRHQPARLRRDRLHRQRTAEAPFAAHGDAEQRPQDQEHDEVRREGGEGAEDRVAEDVQHQRRFASPPVAEAAEDEGADEPHRQRQEERIGDRRDLDAELLGDVLEQEGQEEEIERVEHPAEEGGGDRLLLIPRKVHRRPPWATALASAPSHCCHSSVRCIRAARHRHKLNGRFGAKARRPPEPRREPRFQSRQEQPARRAADGGILSRASTAASRRSKSAAEGREPGEAGGSR